MAADRSMNRPKYLNLFKIRLPLTGIISLAHRASGVLLFIAIPFCVWMLERSVTSPEGFVFVQQLLAQPLLKVAGLVIFWSLAHHFFAGIRFLLVDMDIGVDKKSSRYGAWVVVAAEVGAMLLLLWVWL